eukprot:TRINITY_DN34891_c0_g1_i1.p1 TRINITY_DN34891_c0_g1~~TRINITY_DN34891_c0_g1_i1.p1  ORF type:complete len:527 (-),score=139.40 TRINITY_DN34891_c0_g1_i1:114-1694(-)
MGAALRCPCSRASESGDALDRLSPEEREARRAKMNYTDKTLDAFLKCSTESGCYEAMKLRMMYSSSTAGYKLDPEGRAIAYTTAPVEEDAGIFKFVPKSPAVAASPQDLEEVRKALAGSKKVIVGSVRMGYGHHRLAYSALTWAKELGAEPYLLDMLSPDCMEAEMVRNMDHWYSKFSRMAANAGGCIDDLWGQMMLQGDLNALRICVKMSERIRAVLAGLPTDVPIITSYPMVGNMAVACGFKKVVNLIFDNYPQYFVLVPGAMNFVQSPSYFDKLLDMGVPSSHLRYAGHWVSSEICKNVVQDSQYRMQRCAKKCPRRLLIAVGGAGAQLKLLQELFPKLKKDLDAKRLRVYVNTGDHKHIFTGLTQCLKALGIDYADVHGNEQSEAFVKAEPLSAVDEPAGAKSVTVFHFDSHFAAFRCTDRVIRIADILVTKPSELAFFPIPKLHIRRVGAHEAFSAVRASELGDGTVECRTVDHTVRKVAQLIEDDSPLFKLMNDCVIRAAQIQTYEGSRVACEYALGLKN